MTRISQRRGVLVRLAVALLATAVVAAACSDSDADVVAGTTTSTQATSPPSSDAPSSTTTDTTTPADTTAATTAAPATTAPVATTGPPFSTDTSDRSGPSQGEPSGLLTDVRLAGQDGFDRFVLEFEGTGIPQYLVFYTTDRISDTADNEVAVDGEAVLAVVVFPARRVDIEDPDFTPSYDGPLRLASDTEVIREAVFVEDFEANMFWALGLDGERGFEVMTLSDPPRLVVDVSVD